MNGERTGWQGDDYQSRFDEREAAGADVHGEAALVTSFHPRSVLDAGCGTGRVARELARRGVEVVGVDRDASMIATARRLSPGLTWLAADVCDVELGRRFDIVVMAGNVPLFTPPGTHTALVAGCARHLVADGAFVCGFELGRGYELAAFDDDCSAAGLTLAERWSTWNRDPFGADDSYAVTLHRRRAVAP